MSEPGPSPWHGSSYLNLKPVGRGRPRPDSESESSGPAPGRRRRQPEAVAPAQPRSVGHGHWPARRRARAGSCRGAYEVAPIIKRLGESRTWNLHGHEFWGDGRQLRLSPRRPGAAPPGPAEAPRRGQKWKQFRPPRLKNDDSPTTYTVATCLSRSSRHQTTERFRH